MTEELSNLLEVW